ncbi:DUF397 domain-containing protein [Saccharopolyspora elongata]|uniref:DUF397 domain-containing protein n=1 Tax=Saccharopolyspora elongata TaxID=2530387 RepID=A0A4R4XR36_9PSEU|nr:DUF397 domain-containing protein [Saccharopolyspora elongata]TDD33918.1 DUF397 domain-containing protein [Saccharopolyspora elongata]
MGPNRRDAAADQAPDQVVAQRDFHKATRIEPDKNCVRVARRDGWVELRDDKTVLGAPDDHRLVFTAEEFDAFLAGVREGRTEGLCLEIARRDVDGMHVFRRRNCLHRVGLPLSHLRRFGVSAGQSSRMYVVAMAAQSTHGLVPSPHG